MIKVPVKIKLFDKDLPVPQYQSKLAAGFDFHSRFDVLLPAQAVTIVKTGIAVSYPQEYWLMVAARSSLHKINLQLVNGVGVVDPDYRGDNDEIGLLIYNFGDKEVMIKKGYRLAQGILIPRILADFTIVDELGHPDRGGLGSTGQ